MLLEVELFPWLEDVEDVEDAGEDELCEAAAEGVFWAAEEAGEVADPAAEVLAELAGAGFTGELLLAGWPPPVLKSWGELTPVAAVVESAYLQELALRFVTLVLEEVFRMGETAPGVCKGCK